jgi:hypothetical protein
MLVIIYLGLPFLAPALMAIGLKRTCLGDL